MFKARVYDFASSVRPKLNSDSEWLADGSVHNATGRVFNFLDERVVKRLRGISLPTSEKSSAPLRGFSDERFYWLAE